MANMGNIILSLLETQSPLISQGANTGIKSQSEINFPFFLGLNLIQNFEMNKVFKFFCAFCFTFSAKELITIPVSAPA